MTKNIITWYLIEGADVMMQAVQLYQMLMQQLQ